jgi:hypothetical protein
MQSVDFSEYSVQKYKLLPLVGKLAGMGGDGVCFEI